MKKRGIGFTIIFITFVACTVIGVSIFGLIFYGDKFKEAEITPPDPNKKEVIINNNGYPEIPDSQIASSFVLMDVLDDDFAVVGYEIVGITSSAVQDGKLVIPKTYQNLPILEIGSAFNNWTEITHVVMPETVKCIGTSNSEGSFKGCTALSSIQFPESSKVVEVGTNAFKNCVSLATIDLSSCQQIGNNAFTNCNSLSSVLLGNNLQIIGDGAFSYTAIESVNLPSTTTIIGTNPFAYSKLQSISVSSGNELYESKDNCVIVKETKTLIIGSENSQVADGVIVIGENSFAGVIAAENIVFPNTVRLIKEAAFKDFEGEIVLNDGLETIESRAFYASTISLIVEEGKSGIPDSVSMLGDEAFYACENLQQEFLARGVVRIGILVFAGETPVEVIILYGGEDFVAETDGEVDFKTGSNITSVTYIVPIPTD